MMMQILPALISAAMKSAGGGGAQRTVHFLAAGKGSGAGQGGHRRRKRLLTAADMNDLVAVKNVLGKTAAAELLASIRRVR